MKYLVLILALSVALIPSSAFASCPDQNGPFTLSTRTWYTFTFDPSCASTSGSVSTSTLSCFSSPAHQFGTGLVDYTMTVPSGMGGTHWDVQIYVDFDDPSSYSNDGIAAFATVWHNGTPSNYTIFFHSGNQGSLSCTPEATGLISAADGDTIEVIIETTNYTSATMKSTPPIIFSN